MTTSRPIRSPVSSGGSSQQLRPESKSPVTTYSHPKIKPSLQQALSGLNEDLRALDLLRGYGDSSHGSYINKATSRAVLVKAWETEASTDCCGNLPEYPSDKYAKRKSEPATLDEKSKLAEFTKEIGNLKNRIVRERGLEKKSFGYISEIETYASKILNRQNSKERPIVRHDLSILVSEVIADVVGKVAKHPNDKIYTERHAKSVIKILTKNFSGYLRGSEYKNLFFIDGEQSRIMPLSPDDLICKIKKHLVELQKAKNKMKEPGAGWGVRFTAGEAYQAGAALTLHMLKPSAPPTRLGDVKRIDHHYHNHPYDNNGNFSKFSPLNWESEMAQWLGVQHTDIMPIPHQMTAESFDGRKPKFLTDVVRHGYYAGPNRKTEFRSHDATMLVHHNDLEPEQRAKFNACATGLPVDSTRIEEVKQVAKRFAHSVAEGQLHEGRTRIAVNFGEITGYKPALPQEILVGSEKNTEEIQRKFITRSSAVLTAIFKSAQEGISKALKEYQAEGHVVDGIKTKTRVTFHADALPNKIALDRPDNWTGKYQRGAPIVKEATVISNIIAYAKAIDANLTRESPADFPQGVTHEHHLQAAHLMGASIEPNNFQDPTRATELHQAFRDFRKNCQALRVTTDASWLTASARAVNCGMHVFFDQSDDPDLKEIAMLIKTADDLANNCFMFLHGGERFFEIHMLNGDHTDTSVLNMATMRTAQKKAARTYHATLGALHDKLQDPQVNKKVADYVSSGVDAAGLVKPGNYPGLFLELSQDKNIGKQDRTPIVWGTDNLTASEARSGDLKMLQYVSQHGALELILLNLGDEAKYPLLDFLAGSPKDQIYSGAAAKISLFNIRDGAEPAKLESKIKPKYHHPKNPLLHVRAPQDAGGGGALTSKKERNLSLKDDRASEMPSSISLDSKRSVGSYRPGK